ncbi:hypothetical protein PFISCL1PPCAC_23737, partial [Pristionchus fissidentatus]
FFIHFHHLSGCSTEWTNGCTCYNVFHATGETQNMATEKENYPLERIWNVANGTLTRIIKGENLLFPVSFPQFVDAACVHCVQFIISLFPKPLEKIHFVFF